MSDEEDCIVEEIPVFLSKTLKETLYLFQYPTKANSTNNDNANVVNCCMKPINQEVKVDFGYDIDSRHYDRFKAEQFATAADGKSTAKGERPSFKRGIMDKLAFVSSSSLTDIQKYIVGIYADKELHLTPLASILQMRPALSHFDKDDKRKKAEQKALNEEEDDEELQQVTVKFARSGANAKKAKEQPGYDNLLKRSVDEPWCETLWHPRTSHTAEMERQKLFAMNQQEHHSLVLDSSKYLNKLVSSEDQAQHANTVVMGRVVNRSILKNLPLMEQLKVMLRDAKMLTYSEVMHILSKYVDPPENGEKVLRTLQQVGVLLHGNWLPQSEVVYPPGSSSYINGISAEQMIQARDYVLFKFSRVPYLYRNQVVAATQLPPVEVLQILQSVAVLCSSTKGWELLLPPDKEFELRNPELVQRQEMVWRATQQIFNDMDCERSPKRVRKRSVREGGTG